jgi:uncharacterized protein YabN with tetrapyrrole methylase and pyrophosphatase domain
VQNSDSHSCLDEINELWVKAKDFGFIWQDIHQIFHQIDLEAQEVKEIMDDVSKRKELEGELGDLIHAALSIALYLDTNPKQALETHLKKYKARLDTVISLAQESGLNTLEGQSYETAYEFWKQAKNIVG